MTEKNKIAVALGRLSAKKRTKKQQTELARSGGIASAKKHSKKQRRAIALKGWATRKKKAKKLTDYCPTCKHAPMHLCFMKVGLCALEDLKYKKAKTTTPVKGGK